MTNGRFKELLGKYLSQQASDEELAEFFAALPDPEFEAVISEAIDKDLSAMIYSSLAGEDRKRALLARIIAKTESSKNTLYTANRSSHLIRRWVAAASVLLIIGAGVFFFSLQKSRPHAETADVASVQDIPSPSSPRAILTLADGQQIVLDSIENGAVAIQGDVHIQKDGDGSIVYRGDNRTEHIQYNTLTVPRGSQISSIVLADGSKAILNVASSLKYPVAFIGNERRVEITGEVYFEVSKDPSKPFIVDTHKDKITVVGTSFNVNSYHDEPYIKTSLLEGIVRIGELTLKPGQAYIDGRIVTTNLERDLAWKNGVFNFEDRSLDEVMRALARWYDLEVIYPEGIPQIVFGGGLNRDLSLVQILKVLERSEVHFGLEGHRLIVKP